MTVLHGDSVTLRPVAGDDLPELTTIRNTPEVLARWAEGELYDEEAEAFVIEHAGRVAGLIQYGEENDPMYRHAGIDLYVDPALHGKGIGTDAVRTLARHLIHDLGHHRLVIDPAADNAAAIRTYGKVGFKPVGVLRKYERGADGQWHDGLLMDLLAEELTRGAVIR